MSEAQTDRGVEVITAALTDDGPLTREQLRLRLDAAGVPTAGQALVHLLVAASIRGLVVRGPMVDGHHAFVAVSEWLGAAPTMIDRDEALRRLARRYLVGHGPASARDLSKWAGITLGDARRSFGALGDEVEPFGDETMMLVGHDEAAPLPPPTLLGGFDPILCGWSSREEFVGAHQSVVTVNGLFRPVALVNGRVVATWAIPDRIVTITALESIPTKARRGAHERRRRRRALSRPPCEPRGDQVTSTRGCNPRPASNAASPSCSADGTASVSIIPSSLEKIEFAPARKHSA